VKASRFPPKALIAAVRRLDLEGIVSKRGGGGICPDQGQVAVREGFEPSIGVNLYTLSKRAPSTARPPHLLARQYSVMRLATSLARVLIISSA